MNWKNFELIKLDCSKDDFTLLDFQAFAIYQALQADTFYISLPTGTGKTLCSIATYLYYKEIYPDTKLMIVTTNSALFQFAEEFSKFFNHNLLIQVIHAKAEGIKASNYQEQRKDIIKNWGKTKNPDVILMNYPIFRSEKENIIKAIKDIKKQGRSFVVFDEATAFKDLKPQISKAVAAVSKLVDKKLCLTATLLKGKLEEIYGMFKNMKNSSVIGGRSLECDIKNTIVIIIFYINNLSFCFDMFVNNSIRSYLWYRFLFNNLVCIC